MFIPLFYLQLFDIIIYHDSIYGTHIYIYVYGNICSYHIIYMTCTYIYIYINKLFQLFSNMQLAILKKIYWNLSNIYLALTQISQFNMPLLVVSFYLCCTAMWTRDVKLSVKLTLDSVLGLSNNCVPVYREYFEGLF